MAKTKKSRPTMPKFGKTRHVLKNSLLKVTFSWGQSCEVWASDLHNYWKNPPKMEGTL